MLPLLFALLLCLQWVAGDDAARLARHNSPAATSHVLSQLLVRNKFAPRDNGDGCIDGWHVCPNFPDECAPDGSYCCSETGNCPDDTNCFGIDQCCPQDAQTCGGKSCCDPGSTCCSDSDSCCDSGYFCCTDSLGGCCPDGSTCTAGVYTCTGGGSSVTLSLVVPTYIPPTLGTTLVPTTIGSISIITPTFSTPSNSSSSTTSSSSPTVGGTSGSSHSTFVTSIARTVGLAAVVGIIALGGPVF